ncbi:MAG: hypothetical protein FWF99_03930 [Desulfovibrionaceae bacterium]|nr:hypothetical protein [Desulfovibrionaceae bacterium]
MDLKPYYQGQLDYFCAIYSLINALRLTSGLQLHQGRDILGSALLELSARPLLWQSLLQNRTDSYWLVDYLLGRFCREGTLALRVGKLPLRPSSPIEDLSKESLTQWLDLQNPQPVSLDDLREEDLYRPTVFEGTGKKLFWSGESLRKLLRLWLPGGLLSSISGGPSSRRCLLLRFHRFLAPETLLISHWSAGREFQRQGIALFDCTISRQAVHHLPLRRCAFHPEEVGRERLLALEPESLYFLESRQ